MSLNAMLLEKMPRFRLHLPNRGLPMAFAILPTTPPTTEFDSWKVEEATLSLMESAKAAGWRPFDVTIDLPKSQTSALALGMIMESGEALDLAEMMGQPSFYWIERAVVWQVRSHDGAMRRLGDWDLIAAPPAHRPDFHFIGAPELLQKSTTFICSPSCPLGKKESAIEWGRQQTAKGRAVVSGFDTPIESAVLETLIAEGGQVVHVLSRDLPKRLLAWQERLLSEQRLLLMTSQGYGRGRQPMAGNFARRNEFLISLAKSMHFHHISDDTKLNFRLRGTSEVMASLVQ